MYKTSQECFEQIKLTMEGDHKLIRHEKGADFDSVSTLVVSGDEMTVVSDRHLCTLTFGFRSVTFRFEMFSSSDA